MGNVVRREAQALGEIAHDIQRLASLRRKDLDPHISAEPVSVHVAGIGI